MKLKRSLIILFFITNINLVFSIEYNISYCIDSIKYGEKSHNLTIITDEKERITYVKEDNSYEEFYNYQSDEINKIIHNSEQIIETYNNKNGFNLVRKDMNRKYVYKNSIMYVFYNDVDGVLDDTIIEHKYTYKKNENGYVINKYSCGDLEEDSFFVKEGMFTIDKRILHTKDETINKVNYLIVAYAMKDYSYPGIQAFIPMFFTDTDFSYSFDSISANTELKEGETLYSANNLFSVEGNPWVSTKNNGVGDIITIKLSVRDDIKLAFYNGFQSVNKPYLYNNNSRVRKVNIKNLKLNTQMELELQDTKDRQIVDISQILCETGLMTTIEIEILSAYPGNKWSDLCIQAILPVF